MTSPFEARERELLLLDTGPIRELVLFHAVDHFGFERLRPSLRFIQDRDSYQRCGQFIDSFRRKTTSASVVVELYHWIRKTDPGGHERLWDRVYEEFERMGMGEEVVRLLEMDRRLVARLGPVDVSLLELARRYATHKPIVFTVDFSGLYQECRNAGLDVCYIREVTLM